MTLLKLVVPALFALLAAASLAAAPAPPPPTNLEAFIDGVVESSMATDHLAGVSVAVVQGDRVIHLKGYGTAGLKPLRAVDPSATLFRIGSVSKTFTWILLMRLVEEGKVDLGAPVNRYLPSELQMPDQGFTKPIRVIDLMAHAPGLEDIALGHLVIEDPAKLMPMTAYLARYRPDRVREPGQFSTYSNYGAMLAGAIVSHVRGQDFQTVADTEIFRPLGMAHSTFREPYAPRADLPAPMPPELAKLGADPLSWAGGRYVAHPFEHFAHNSPGGGVSTTAADMARYMRMLLRDGELDGVRIFGPETARAFRTPILKSAEGVNGWAHGFMVASLPGGIKGYGHGGATQFHLSYMQLVPALDLGIFVTTNSAGGRSFIERLPLLIVNNLQGQTILQRPGDPRLAAKAELYAGEYYSTRRPYAGLEKFLLLLEGRAELSVADGYLVSAQGGQARAWVPEGGPGRFRDALGIDVLQMNLGPDGRASSFDTRGGTARMERAGPLMSQTLLYALAGLSLLVALWMAPTRLKRLLNKAYIGRWAERIDRLSLLTALLWIGGFLAMGVWAVTLDETSLLIRFPTPLLLAASWLAVAATVATAGLAALSPFAWTERRDWPRLHATQHILAILIFGALALVLGTRGFLAPWV
jgi:CubicO group peptidase (beta-lactamase class C family)